METVDLESTNTPYVKHHHDDGTLLGDSETYSEDVHVREVGNEREGITSKKGYLSILICVVIVFIIGFAIAGSQSGGSDDSDSDSNTGGESEKYCKQWNDIRLPSYIRPVEYDMTIYTDLARDTDTYKGKTSIKLEMDKKVRESEGEVRG